MSIPFVEHPTIKAPSPEQVAALVRAVGVDEAKRRLLEIEEKRREAMRLEKEDPYRYGFVPPHWLRAEALLDEGRELLILGGNRAAKSRFSAWKLMKEMCAKPNSRWWCFYSNAPKSISEQQATVFEYIPKEWKDVKKGRYTNVNFSQKNGFSDGTFILPNRAQCWFLTYEMDKSLTIEGGEIDGFWADELVPEDWLDTLMYRIVTRKGWALTTFTPVNGWTPTVGMYLDGAITLEEEDADLLPKYGELLDAQGRKVVAGYEQVPRLQQSITRPRAKVFYFYSRDNPYNPYDELKKALDGQPTPKIKERAYGVPHKSRQTRFPLFSDRVHLVPWSKVPSRGTRYHFADPCGGSRNWFMAWFIVDPFDRVFLYREWPQQDIYVPGEGFPGAWAESDKKEDGRRGPGQAGFGWGLPKYKEEIERLEARAFSKSEVEVQAELAELKAAHEAGRMDARKFRERVEKVREELPREDVEARFLDRRYGNASSSIAGKEDAVTLMEECLEIGLDFGETSAKDDIDQGVALINNLLSYDTTKPLGHGNEPKLFIYEGCLNTIFALKTWSGKDGRHGATKDPIDLLRYMAAQRLEYVDPVAERGHKGGSY